MANTITTSASDFVNMMKNYKPKQAKQTEWEEYFLKPLQQQTQAEVSSVQAKTGYDISGAFANYKKAERQILQASQLGSGFKQELIEGLGETYEQQYASEKVEELGDILNIQSEYTKALDTENARLTGIGKTLSKIDIATQNYLTENKGYKLENIYKTDTSGTQTLTDYGSAAFRKAMYDDPEYLKYLQDEGLYEDYATYRTDLNKYMAGIDENTFDYDSALNDVLERQDVIDKYSSEFGKLNLSDTASASDYKLAYQQEIAKNVDIDQFRKVKRRGNNKIYSNGKLYKVSTVYVDLGGIKKIDKPLKDFLSKSKIGSYYTYNNEVYIKVNNNTLVKLKE